MADKATRKTKGFPIALAVYAGIFLTLAVAGLACFWGFLTAYEASRPENTLNAYMESLTAQKVLAADEDLLDQVDPHTQSRQQATQAALQALSGEFRYIKDVKASVQGHYVYTLMCGNQVIGGFDMVQKKSVGYGFFSWEIFERSTDLSFLLEAPLVLTVPEEFSLVVNGNTLPEEKITQKSIPYEALKGCYESYELPYLVQYTAGPFIGKPDIEIRDGSCEAIATEDLADPNSFLKHCNNAQTQRLTTAADAFLRKYIDFTCNTGKDPAGNLAALSPYILSGSSLQKRMHQALDGLNWVPDRGATLVSLKINRCLDIGNGRLLCDMTYVVNTVRHNGTPQSTTNCKVIFAESGGSLKAETMLNY